MVLLLYRYCKFEDDEIDYTTSYIQKKEIKINLINSKQSKKDSSFIINIGSLDNLAIKNVEDEILYLKSIKMISHVQCQKLFSNLPLNFSTNDRIDLNYFPIFEKLDRIICFLYEQNIGVFLNIDISDFESNNYKLLYKNFFLHMHNQFNNEIFKSWNINIVFNKKIVEGNLYKFKEIKKYFKYISPQILIGIQIHLENFEDNNLIFLKEILIDCNFISYKEYSGILTKDQSNQTDINDKQDFLTKKINIISSLLRENSINLPLYLLEWNTITGKTNTTNGSFFRGAIIIQEYIHLNPFVAGFGFWLNIDLYENNTCHLSDNNKYGLQLFHYNQKNDQFSFAYN